MNPFSAVGEAVLRGLAAVGQHHDASTVGGFLQRPTDPAPDAQPLVEVDQISAVVTRCINAISESCANLAPLKLYDVGTSLDGRRMPKEVLDHPAIQLWRHINPVQTACVYIQQVYADLLSEGNHFAALDVQNGLPVNMVRMPPQQVTVNPHRRKIIGSYTWKTPDGKSRTYAARQVAHLATRNPDSIYRGMGLLPRLRSQIIMDRSLRNFKLNQIKNGVPAQLLFTVQRGFAEEEDIERFYDEVWRRSRGAENAGRPFFVREGEMKVDVIPRPTSAESEWLAAMKFTKQEIAMLFGVPPSRLSDYTESFRASATEQSRFFLQDTVMGWHRLFEDYLNTQFLPAWFPSDARRMMFKHDYNGVPALALAMRDMATVQEIAIRNGMRTPNQGAVAMGDAAHENEAADELYMNGKKLGEDPDPQPATPPGINTEPGSTDPPRDDGDGVPADEEQEEADRMWADLSEQMSEALYTRGGMKVNLDDLWLASATFQKQEDGDDGDLIIFGVASSDRVDRQNTIVNQESLSKALKPYLKTGGVYYNHNWAIPAGIPLEAETRDGKTLLASKIGRDYDLMLRDPHALVETSVRYPVNDLRTAIKQGMIRNYSIAFNAEAIESDDDGPVELQVSDLFEISIVSIPANVDASFSVQRASENPIFKKMFLAEAKKQKGIRNNSVTSAEEVATAIHEGSLRFGLEDDGVDWDKIAKELENVW